VQTKTPDHPPDSSASHPDRPHPNSLISVSPGRLSAGRAAVEALGAVLLIVPALVTAALVFRSVGLTSTALPPLGLWLVVALCTQLLHQGGARWSDMGFVFPPRLLRSVWQACLLAAGMLLTTTVAAGVLDSLGLARPDLDVFRDQLLGNTGLYVQMMILVVWGSAAFGEELVIRGFVMPRLEWAFGPVCRGWGFGQGAARVPAVMLQALCFGAVHAYQGWAGVIMTGLLGAVLGVVYYRCGRTLAVPILAHGLFDSVGVTGLYLGIG